MGWPPRSVTGGTYWWKRASLSCRQSNIGEGEARGTAGLREGEKYADGGRLLLSREVLPKPTHPGPGVHRAGGSWDLSSPPSPSTPPPEGGVGSKQRRGSRVGVWHRGMTCAHTLRAHARAHTPEPSRSYTRYPIPHAPPGQKK